MTLSDQARKLMGVFEKISMTADEAAVLEMMARFSQKDMRCLVQAVNDEGASPLHIAARLNMAAVLRVLLNEENVLPDCFDARGVTPLHLASAQGHAGAVRVLLEAGASPATPVATVRGWVSKDGIYPGFNAFHLAAAAGSADVLRALLESGRDVDGLWAAAFDHQRRDLVDPLRLAALSRSADTLRVLLEAGASPRLMGEDGLTLLRFFCKHHPAADILDIVLAAGPDIHTDLSRSGETLLFAAAFVGWREGFMRLAALGVSPIRFGHNDWSPEDLATMRQDKNGPRGPRRLLHAAASGGDPEIVSAVIAMIPHELNARTEGGQTPLHLAALLNRLDAVERLLAAGADPSIVDMQGRPPDLLAQSLRQQAVRSKLLQAVENFNRTAAVARPLRPRRLLRRWPTPDPNPRQRPSLSEGRRRRWKLAAERNRQERNKRARRRGNSK